jgi:hypothetical protein
VAYRRLPTQNVPTTLSLGSRALLESRSVTSSLCPCAAPIIALCIAAVTKRNGGRPQKWSRWIAQRLWRETRNDFHER